MTTEPLPRRAYRLQEVASMLGVSVRTLTRERDRGNLTTFSVGTTILVSVEDLDAYIRKQKSPSPA